MPIEQLGAIGGAVAVVVLIVYLVMRHKAAIRAVFSGFAAKHGLQFTSGAYPNVSGQVDGRFTVARSYPMPRQQLVHFQILVGIHGNVPKGLIAYAGRADKGVVTGDSQLDNRVHFEAAEPHALLAYLTPARKAAFLELTAAKLAVSVPPGDENGGPVVIFAQPGFKTSVDWFEEKYQLALGFAKRLD